MFCLFRLFHIDLGLGEIKITFEDLKLHHIVQMRQPTL